MIREIARWIADNSIALENAAWLLTWLAAWIVAAFLAAIVIGPRRMQRMLRKLDRACERWMGR